jgi:GTP cyclohydrolase IA
MNIKIPKHYFNQEELQNTPTRFNNFLNEFFTRKAFNFTVFPANEYQGKVSTKIKFHSLCSHHLIPFFGEVLIEYIPDKSICGLSKLSRTVDYFSKKPQTQENLTQEIFDFLNNKLNPKELFVTIEAQHLCMEMRGIKKDSLTITELSLNMQ